MATENSVPQWEQFKENAAPLERGRNVKILSRALDPSMSATNAQRKEDDPNIREFESLVRPSEKFSEKVISRVEENAPPLEKEKLEDLLVRCRVDKDPIVHWLRYIKYHEETYPSDTQSQFLLMERCAHALLHHPRYPNDTRFVRVCILYADRTSAPHETFKFYHKHKIGSSTAIFWLAWAWVAEKRKDFPFAEKIFKKALAKKIKPTKMVEDRYKQFQRRMSRHWLNAAQEEVESEDEYDNKENRRGVLSGLTEEGVRYNHRGEGANSMAFGLANRPNRSTVTNNNGLPPKGSNKGFSIFEENNENDQNNCILDQSVMVESNMPRHLPPVLAKEEDRQRENTAAAERWNERGGLRTQGYDEVQIYNENQEHVNAASVAQRWAGTDIDSRVAGGTSSQLAFQVYVDEDCAPKSVDNDAEDNVKKTNSRAPEKSLRQRMDDVKPITTDARLLGRNPAPSILARDQHASHQSRSKRPDSSKTKRPNFVLKDENGQEVCFEELRARAKNYSLISSEENFNLLAERENEGSFMDVDESTIQDISMEDTSKSHIIMEGELPHINEYANSSTVQPEASRKVLFGVNTTIGSHSLRNAQNTSTSSSTIHSKDAVGIVGEREETINTKFAARELSMMFSSPGGQDISIPASRVKLNTSTPSIMPLFSVHEDAKEDKPFDNGLTNGATVGNTSGFQIFCDDENQENILDESMKKESNFETTNEDKVVKSTGFQIFCDADNEENLPLSDTVPASKSQPSGAFTVFVDNDEKEFDSKCLGEDDGTVLTEDAAAFGDISLIAPADGNAVSNIERGIKRMSVSKKANSMKVLDYRDVHKKNSEKALNALLFEAERQQQRKKLRRRSLSINLFDRTKKNIPTALKKVPRKGTEIDMGGFEFIVNHELGQGTYGTVLLCDAPGSEEKFALKLQTPIGCLALEYSMLDIVMERIQSEGENWLPFPKPLSFVAFSDGGVLGMTAGSESGCTLVDVVNAHKASVPELIALHYTSRMLLHLEKLHLCGKVLHCDIKPDNWVLTSSPDETEAKNSDLMLVDFGRAIDLEDLAVDSSEPFRTRLHGNIAAEDMECPAMCSDKSWCVDHDAYGVCASAHVLLFGCYMEIGENFSSKRWEPKRKCRRYWQKDLWHLFFDTLLNLDDSEDGLMLEDYSTKLSMLKAAFDQYLGNENQEKQVQSLLRAQADILVKGK